MTSAERIRNLSPEQRTALLEKLLVNEDAAADRQLVAFVELRPGATVSEGDLQEFLRPRLPEFMLPARISLIEALPRHPNGKVDRNALAPMTFETAPSQTALIPPRNETEAKIHRIWSEALRIGNFGVEDNFFRLGGHSLLALQVMARVRELFQVDLPLKTLFELPTVAGLAAALARFTTAAPVPTIKKLGRRIGETPLLPSDRSRGPFRKNFHFLENT